MKKEYHSKCLYWNLAWIEMTAWSWSMHYATWKMTFSHDICFGLGKKTYIVIVYFRVILSSGAGVGVTKPFSPFRYFPHFPLLSKQMLAIEYRVYIWQVLPQLSCSDTCQIWMWFKESNRYFCMIENFAYWEISERSFSNPHPWS